MKRILYVEDNRDTAEAVKIFLENEGFAVELAYDGSSGVSQALNSSFDLILLDIMLPDMSGWDIFEKIKDKVHAKYAFLSAIPVSEERLEELQKAGISDYIMKPFAKDDLIKKVKAIVQ